MSARGAPRDIAHEGFLTHRRLRWAKVAVVLGLLAIAAYVLTDPVPRPNGGSAAGYLLGTAATLLVVWLSLIGLRKRIIGSRPYSLKAWTSAHVYLGLSLAVIATLHTGFQFGLNVHTLAYALMMLVILSGGYGVWAYAMLPAKLSANRAEATEPQLLEAVRTLDRQLHAIAQPMGPQHAGFARTSLEQSSIGGTLWQRLTARQPHCGNRRALEAVQAEVDAGLRRGPGDPALRQLLFLLERKEAALAQARRHIALKTRLELWLYVHVPATFALLAALASHILSVFFYW